MILADKIIDLRKKAGWSQEELAEKLAVTRQSVSKWEGAQSIPDMDKVVQMSRLFGVTTDYLLKDEIEIAEPTVNADDRQPPLRRVTIGEASDYLALRRTAAPKMALATMLCIFSPIALIGLAAVSELSASAFPLREETAAGIGLCVLMILVAIAVTLFLSCGNKAKEYEFLEKEPFETEYGVTGMVKERQKAFKPTYDRMNTIGTVLCVLSFVPLFAVMAVRQDGFFMTMAVCLLLAVVGIGPAEGLQLIRCGPFGEAGGAGLGFHPIHEPGQGDAVGQVGLAEVGLLHRVLDGPAEFRRVGAVPQGHPGGNAGEQGGAHSPGVQHHRLALGQAAGIVIDSLIGPQGHPVGLQRRQHLWGKGRPLGKEKAPLLGEGQVGQHHGGARNVPPLAGSGASRCPPGW